MLTPTDGYSIELGKGRGVIVPVSCAPASMCGDSVHVTLHGVVSVTRAVVPMVLGKTLEC